MVFVSPHLLEVISPIDAMPPKSGSQTEATADQDLVGRLAGLEKALIERLEYMTDMFKTELHIVVKRFEQSTKEILEDNTEVSICTFFM